MCDRGVGSTGGDGAAAGSSGAAWAGRTGGGAAAGSSEAAWAGNTGGGAGASSSGAAWDGSTGGDGAVAGSSGAAGAGSTDGGAGSSGAAWDSSTGAGTAGSSGVVYGEASAPYRFKPDGPFHIMRCVNLFDQHHHSPLKITHASYQYLYDGPNQYLDCVNSVSHVGHCHPAVVKASSDSLETAFTCSGWEVDYGEIRYPKELQKILPAELDTLLFCNSGSEAVDLALQLSRLFTSGTDVIVVENAFHGATDSLHHLSTKLDQSRIRPKADWVHTVPMPDLYRGPYQSDDPLAVEKYVADARSVMDSVQQGGKKIACFIAEPMLTVLGCIMPPNNWFREICKVVREFGGLCIADEVQTGLGRTGSHYWSFQASDVTPDMMIIGKSLGNGYPLALVVTTKKIAEVLGERIKEYPCTRMMDAVGCVVLEVLQQEHLINNADVIGALLKTELLDLQKKHEHIGDVRGKGLMLGIEIVWNKLNKEPAQEIADQIVQRMKRDYIIMANEGENGNILLLMPPMCFTAENVIVLCRRLHLVLFELADPTLLKALHMTRQYRLETSEGRQSILQPQEDDDETLKMDHDRALQEYQDVD